MDTLQSQKIAKDVHVGGMPKRDSKRGSVVTANPQPAYPAAPVFGYAHVGHGLHSQIAETAGMFAPALATDFFLDFLPPESVTNKVILANILAEVIDAGAVCEAIKVATPKHGALPDNAWGDKDGDDSSIELCVR